LRLRRVEPHKEIAGTDAHAVLHLDFRHDSAARMLNGLHIGLHDKVTRHDDCTCERHQGEPAAAQQRRQNENAKASSQFVIERPTGAQHQPVGRIGRRRRVVAAHDEVHARHQTVAGTFDQPCRRLGRWRSGRGEAGALDAHRMMQVDKPRHLRRRLSQIHAERIARGKRRALPPGRHRYLAGCVALPFRLVRGLQSELLEADVDRLSHPAFFLLRALRGLASTRLRLSASPRRAASAVGPIFAIEGTTKPLQLENESCALRPQSVGTGIVAPMRRRAVDVVGGTHD
jgi:hypothetical protein